MALHVIICNLTLLQLLINIHLYIYTHRGKIKFLQSSYVVKKLTVKHFFLLFLAVEGGAEKKTKSTRKHRDAQRGGAETIYYQTRPFNQ